MRIELLQLVDVDISTLPASAYGQVRTRTLKSGAIGYCFSKGATPELPDAVALQFIADGVAVVSKKPTPIIVSRDEILREVRA